MKQFYRMKSPTKSDFDWIKRVLQGKQAINHKQ